ncbi:aldehyde dehydrogenase [Amanita muscaria]
MPSTYTHHFDTPVFKGDVTINTGLFINGQWVDPIEGDSIDVSNPATGQKITAVAGGSAKDVDIAVQAAKKAFKTVWGLHTPGDERGKLLLKLADIIEAHTDELAALEALDVGKCYTAVKAFDVPGCVKMFRYVAGWADKIRGHTIETNEGRHAYTRREPYGVVGQIIPWNFPIVMLCLKLAPALATGNTIVLKPSEITPFTALKVAEFITEAGFPPGTVNIVNGYGHTVGQAISEHLEIRKIAFTGSTLTGRRIMKAAAESNLKVVTLELGGKSPSIIFDDVDIASVAQQAATAVFYNSGQICIAGSRIFVQESIYDKFLEALSGVAKYFGAAAGDPFSETTLHQPLVSKAQFDRVIGYIQAGKEEGAKLHTGGSQIGQEGYFVHPTIFTDVKPEMKIIREEIFGPVAAITKFKDEAEAIELANNTLYGLSCAVFTENVGRAHRVAHAIEAGTIWVNTVLETAPAVPFGGYKLSGIGREFGEQGIESYTQVKSVVVKL